MKKWFIIGLSVLALLFLIVRPVKNYIVNIEDEKQWYAGQLQFEFSGAIDSVTILKKEIGLILFHVTSGSSVQQLALREQNLNDQLEHSKYLQFLVFRPFDKIEIISRNPTICLPGDSIYVNTNKDEISVYRNGEQISTDKVKFALRTKPWFRVTDESLAR